METSRDDFVIAIRSAFLKKSNKQRFSLFGLIFFSIIFLVLGKLNFPLINYFKISIKEVIYRSSFIVSIPEKYVEKSFHLTINHFNLYDNYLEVKKDLENLKKEKYEIDFILSENKRLKQTVDDYILLSNERVAKVLIDNKSPFLRSIIINKGSKDNIELGMAVLDKSYLVGKVIEVNYLTSRVLLLSDLNSKIPVIIEPGGVQSILSGSGKKHGIFQYFKENSDFNNESRVYTSGSGGIFKAGIPIGKVDNSDTLKEKYVNFFSDFSQLSFVKIVSFKRESK